MNFYEFDAVTSAPINSNQFGLVDMQNIRDQEEMKLPHPPPTTPLPSPVYMQQPICERNTFQHPEVLQFSQDSYKSGELGSLWERLCQVRIFLNYTFSLVF